MNIRSITAFADLRFPVDEGQIQQIVATLQAAKADCEAAGLTVQTTRLASQPLPAILEGHGPEKAVAFAKAVEVAAHGTGIDYISLGPVRLTDDANYATALPLIFTACDTVFATIEVATRAAGIDPNRIRLAASLIREASLIDPNGFTNLFMAILANVGPWSPFFPAAYHGGGDLTFAVATESADLAVEAFSGVTSLREARTALIDAIEAQAATIEGAFSQHHFKGIDFSLAPFPEEARSIGRALEKLGLAAFGQAGSLAASAWLTDTLDQAQFKRVGFSGLMLPVLEDSGLAERASDGVLRVSDLLMYSAVCGTGLDTIPLAGDVSEQALAGILFDMSALALRLNKPLTARLMPIPGVGEGEPTAFTFEYFANSHTMPVGDYAIRPPLNGSERIPIGTRSP